MGSPQKLQIFRSLRPKGPFVLRLNISYFMVPEIQPFNVISSTPPVGYKKRCLQYVSCFVGCRSALRCLKRTKQRLHKKRRRGDGIVGGRRKEAREDGASIHFAAKSMDLNLFRRRTPRNDRFGLKNTYRKKSAGRCLA